MEQMRRTEIRAVLDRHRGSKAKVAKSAGVTTVTVSIWLRGRCTSANIAGHAARIAEELLAEERAGAAA